MRLEWTGRTHIGSAMGPQRLKPTKNEVLGLVVLTAMNESESLEIGLINVVWLGRPGSLISYLM